VRSKLGTVVTPNQPIPDRTIVRLKGYQGVAITDSDTLTDTVVSMNNAFDPFEGAGTAQLAGFDQYATLYGSYRVHSSSIRTIVTTGAATAPAGYGAMKVCVVPRTSSTAFTDFNTATGASYSRFKSGSQPYTTLMLGNQLGIRQISGRVGIEGSDAISADVGSAPAAKYYWHVVTQFNTTTTNQAASVDIELTMQIEFYNRLDPADAFEIIQRCRKLIECRKILYASKEEKKDEVAVGDDAVLVRKIAGPSFSFGGSPDESKEVGTKVKTPTFGTGRPASKK